MSKRKPDPRGVMAIALFEIAVALERWAAAQERIAETNEILREIAQNDLNFRKHGAETFLAQSQTTIDELAAEARAATVNPFTAVDHITQRERVAFFFQTDGETIDPTAKVARKSARILARRWYMPFTVETDRGVMTGAAGDWLVTNHPADDPGSDMWTISDERFTATYEVLPYSNQKEGKA